jgi:Zn-dependent protease with chaperone function
MSVRVFVIFAVPALAAFVIVAAVGALIWWPLVILGIPAALAAVWWFERRSDEAVLRLLHTRPVAEREGERITRIVERLSLSSGVTQPDIRVIEDSAVNLAIVSGRTNTLVATTGLLTTLNSLEMEGAVAHSLSKIESGFGVYDTLVASAPWAVPEAIRKVVRSWDNAGDGVVQFDLRGVSLTRYPPGLRSALQRIEDARTDVSGGENLGASWLVPPLADRIPVEHRVEVLGEL